MSDFEAKMHKIRFPLGLHHRPRWGSSQRSPRPPAVFEGAYFEGEERGREGEGEGKRRGRDGRNRGKGRGYAPQYFGLETPMAVSTGGEMEAKGLVLPGSRPADG